MMKVVAKSTARAVVPLVAIWALAVWSIAMFAQAILPKALHAAPATTSQFSGVMAYLAPFVRFDAPYYVEIATHGYNAAQPILAAFFPLWPLLIRLVAWPLQLVATDPTAILLVAVALPAGLTMLAAGMIWRWLLAEGYSHSQAKLALALILIFPYAFFYLAPYTEALFLLLTATIFWAAVRQRWWTAAIVVMLATALRLPAAALAVALAVEYLSLQRWQLKSLWRAPWLLLTPLGLLAYGLYLQLSQGGWQTYFQAYHIGWPGRVFNPNIFFPFWQALSDVIKTHKLGLITVLAFATFALAVALLIYGWSRMRPLYRVYCVGAMVLPLLTTTLDSLPRYYMLLLPLYPIAATWLEKKPSAGYLVLYIGGLLSALLVVLFVSGYFVG
jgi:hypothetical protein